MARETMQDGRTARRAARAWPANVHGWRRNVARWAWTLTTSLALSLAGGLTASAQAPFELPPPGGTPGTLVAQTPAAAPAAQPAQPAPMPTPVKPADLGAPRSRLEGLPAGVLAPVGSTPVPTKAVQEKFKQFVDGFSDPENTLDLVAGRPRLLRLKEAPFRTQVADENIMTFNILGRSPKELSLLGRNVGSTVFNLWFGDPDDPTKQTLLSYLVHVLPDPEAKERLERVYKALEDEINRAFPDAYICLFLVGDKLVVSGEVKDSVEATKIIQVIRANAPPGGFPRPGAIPTTQVSLNLNSLVPGEQAPNTLEDFLLIGESNIINLLRIPGEQQVMLKVTVAEISRAASRSIGLNFAITNNQGIQVFAQNTGGLINSRFGAGSVNNNQAGGIANLPAVLDNGQIPLAIQALRNVNLARSLAEPNLVTLNGQPAYFHAGGEFPVPVITGATATGLQGVSFVPFGVQLSFVPFVTDKDRIRLQLNATVSVRDVGTGTSISSGGGGGGTQVPGLNTRTISTTVEMREGQTLAIGGLLQTNLGGQTTRVPLFGDIPFGGQLFRVDNTSASESELVLLVTPQLVHPMEPNEVPPLPGSDYFEPGDLEFYLHGRLESRRAYDYRSPVMHDCHRMKAYRRCELLYFVGPHGHSDGGH